MDILSQKRLSKPTGAQVANDYVASTQAGMITVGGLKAICRVEFQRFHVFKTINGSGTVLAS